MSQGTPRDLQAMVSKVVRFRCVFLMGVVSWVSLGHSGLLLDVFGVLDVL